MATTKTEVLSALEVNALTGETITRELTSAEIAQLQNQAAADLAAVKAKVAARQSALAKLAELGLTEEEIAAL